jgi:hypothetical protein
VVRVLRAIATLIDVRPEPQSTAADNARIPVLAVM